jgi:tetratricopeptide (TPR) repeat protein
LLAHFQGDEEQTRKWLDASLALAPERDDPDPWWRAPIMLFAGIVEEDHGDYLAAESRFTEALALFRAAGNEPGAGLVLNHLGVAAWGQGNIKRAGAYLEEAVALQRAIGDAWGLSNSLGYLGLVAGEGGNYARAATVHMESLELRWKAGAWEDIAGSLADLAVLAASTGQAEQAARLFGAAEAVRDEIGREPKLPERAVFERAEAKSRAVLGPDAFAHARDAGRALPREQAVAEAREIATQIGSSAPLSDRD